MVDFIEVYMNKATFEYSFKIYQPVWHRANGDRGMVTDVSYSLLTCMVKYYVATGVDDGQWCFEGELSDKEVII